MRRSFFNKPKSNSISDRRIYFLAIFGILFAITILGRLFYWQILMHNSLSEMAQNQYVIKKNLTANRGKILSSDSGILATNSIYYQISAVPNEIKNPHDFAVKIAPFIEKDIATIEQLFLDNPQYVILKQKMEKVDFEKLDQEKIEGLIATEINGRYYPENEIAAHLIGFFNLDGKGQYGMEEFFNDMLGGKEGTDYREVDPLQQPIPLGDRELVEPEQGDTLITTIDLYLQEKLYTLLKDATERFKATKGLILVMDPKTGEIISMVSYPSYDPNNYSKSFEEKGSEIFINSSLENFEPGSIFKVITMASAIDSEVVLRYSPFYDSGKLVIGKNTINNAGHAVYGNIDMTGILAWSSNVGSGYLAQKMGRNVFYKYIQTFGFGKKTGIELMGESSGILHKPEQWADLDLASIGFGQAIGVTPIQMVTALSAVANGGNLFKPMLVKKIIQDGKENEQFPRLMRRVIRENSSKTVSEMLYESTKYGWAKKGIIPGYKTAGKTGTAQQAKSDGTGYEEKKVIGSYVGFAPADNPRFVMLVSFHLNENLSNAERWGESTAGPVFSDAGKIILQRLGVPPSN